VTPVPSDTILAGVLLDNCCSRPLRWGDFEKRIFCNWGFDCILDARLIRFLWVKEKYSEIRALVVRFFSYSAAVLLAVALLPKK
jgi:hypothetical protein